MFLHSLLPPPAHPFAHPLVLRLCPLIDWDKESRDEINSLRTKLEATSNSLLLARAERGSLLRENDKIIAHYRCTAGAGGQNQE